MRVILMLVAASVPRWRRFSLRALAIAFAVLICCGGSSAYSVLTHEEIVDLVWADQIRPLLLKRYPGLTDDQIKEAHAYAYGGAVIQDLGYYPFGSKDFSKCALTRSCYPTAIWIVVCRPRQRNTRSRIRLTPAC